MRVAARTRSNIAAPPTVVIAALLAALLAMMLGGCGQKGPLMLPGDADARTGAPVGGVQPGGESPDEDEEESATGAQREPR